MQKNEGYISHDAVCPFYKRENDRVIRCEGFTRGSGTEIVFKQPARKSVFCIEKCRSNYATCRYAAMLMRMYQGEDA